MRQHVRGGGLLALALAVAAGGCNSETTCSGAECGATDPKSKAQSFESDLPAGSQSAGTLSTRGGNASSDASAVGESAPQAPNGAKATATSGMAGSAEAQRAITEADIIQLQGNKLYALSRVAGLAVIDVSDPGALKLLGRYRELPAEPFEMYLRDGVALVMFTGWGQYAVADDGTASWVSTSKLLALDIADPAKITQLGSFDLPGSISDSRIVGDVLYVVGHEDGYCWRCEQDKPRTSIVSLNVADPKAVKPVDSLYYADENSSWGQRSVTVTSDRMYVAGPEYGQNMPTGSTIQVVDISDAAGDLVEGTSVKVEGQVNNRWQMDEYEGVLRVVSQPPQWWTEQGVVNAKPAVETFKIESSQKLSALGKTEIQLPERDTLRSVRFDGARGYAITAEQKDPLFTLDLSDPAKPRQVGELKIPGFVYHMEPRGDRLLGLGFDQGNPQGSITVSLFDVKDMTKPTELSRVNFGGSWGYLPEDQNRIHKVFRVLEDKGMILVPFAGWSDQAQKDGCYASSYVGGVQLIDFGNDALKARGSTPSRSQVRRALLVKDALISTSDERVESFDIADRDKPALKSELVLSSYVSKALQLDGGVVARLGSDNLDGHPIVDFVQAAQASDPNQRLSELDLAKAVGVSDRCSGYMNIEQTFVRGSTLELLYTSQSYVVREKGDDATKRGFLVIDVSNPAKPSVVSNTQWTEELNWYPYYSFYSYGYYGDAVPVVRTDKALAMLESKWEETTSGVTTTQTQKVRLRVVDLRDPKAPKTSVMPFEAVSSYSGLLADGDVVMTSHFEASSSDGKRGRFYIDRFDLSDPGAPEQLAKINVPGALMQFDKSSQRAITSEQVRVEVEGKVPYEDCYKRFAHADWFTDEQGPSVTTGSAPVGVSTKDADVVQAPTAPVLGTCTGYKQRLQLVHLMADAAQLDDTLELSEDKQLFSMSMGDGVLFASVGHGSNYGPWLAVAECFRCGGPAITQPTELLVLGGFAQGEFEEGHITVEDADKSGWYGFWGTPPVYAHGKRALLIGQSDIAIIDATTVSAPKLDKRVPVIGYPSSVDVREDTALIALGNQGVQWLDLSE